MLPWAYLSLAFIFAFTPGATTAMVVGHTLGCSSPGSASRASAAPLEIGVGSYFEITPDPYFLNVAITSFYVGVVPNFLEPGTAWSGVGGLVLLYAAHIAIAFGCHLFWISLFHNARAFFARHRPRQWLDATFGVLLIALAIRIAVR